MLPILSPSDVHISACIQEEREVSGGKGNTANFVWKCSSCKRESSAKFEEKFPVKAYSHEANGQFAPLVTLDCRGLEFIGFDPRVCILFFVLIPNLARLGYLEMRWCRIGDRLPGG